MSDNRPSSDSGYIINPENADEMARLTRQAQSISHYMGHLPPSLDLAPIHAMLDLACGPGEWVLSMASRFPDKHITGIDISTRMIEYDISTAASQGLSNAHFQLSNATESLPFPNASFDLVNARFIGGFMRTTMWPQLLQECLRVLRPAGIFCSCESDSAGSTNSPSLSHYNTLITQVLRLNGQCFTAVGQQSGIFAVLPRLLAQTGFTQVQQEAYAINSSFGQPTHKEALDNYKIFLKLLQPTFVQLNLISQQDVEALYQKTLAEVMSPDFCAITFFQRCWGQKQATPSSN